MRGGRPGLVHEPLRTLFGAGTAAGLTDAQLLERFVSQSRAMMPRPRSPPWCPGMGRWCAAPAGRCSPTRMMPTTCSRRHSSSWRERPGRSGGRNCWATGSTGRHTARPGRSRPGPHVGSNTRRGRRPWHTCGPRPIADGIERQAVRREEAQIDPRGGRPAARSLRAAVVLCDLEGRPQEEVADLLRCSDRTLRRRLDRARDLLRVRLTRRGLAPTASSVCSPQHSVRSRPRRPSHKSRWTQWRGPRSASRPGRRRSAQSQPWRKE